MLTHALPLFANQEDGSASCGVYRAAPANGAESASSIRGTLTGLEVSDSEDSPLLTYVLQLEEHAQITFTDWREHARPLPRSAS
jgi:hypothetical protein